MSFDPNMSATAVNDGGSGSSERKFDYLTVQTEIDGILADVNAVVEIVSRKLTSKDYISGNAKASVDSYIGSVPGKFKPIEESMNKIKTTLDTIKANYLAAETSINTALGSGGSDGAPTQERAFSKNVNVAMKQ